MKQLVLTLLVVFALASCEKNGSGEQPTTPVYEQEFNFSAHANASGDPVHGDPYTMVSYRVGGTSSTAVDIYQIRESAAYGRQWGYYAYDDGTSGRPAGTLVPVVMTFPGNNTTPITSGVHYWPENWAISSGVLNKNPQQAQMLNSVPTTGPNLTTNQGVYRVAMIHPAIPMRNTGGSNLGYLAVYELSDEIYASMPDDANGDGVEDDPFEITVESNGQVHSLPAQTELYPVKSAVKLWFYSEYYTDDAPTTPKSQNFSIASLRLYNVGSNGWYNARTGIVYPNYNYRTPSNTNNYRTAYSLSDVGTDIPNYVDMLSGVVSDGSTPGPGDNGNPIKYTVEQPVFPSDYRGSEGGGLFEVKPLILALELAMGGAVNNVSVPVALKMERGKRYNFYINVTSEMIEITYNVSSPWDDGGSSGDDIGGDKLPYVSIALEYGPGNWGDGGGGNDNIGGN